MKYKERNSKQHMSGMHAMRGNNISHNHGGWKESNGLYIQVIPEHCYVLVEKQEKIMNICIAWLGFRVMGSQVIKSP